MIGIFLRIFVCTKLIRMKINNEILRSIIEGGLKGREKISEKFRISVSEARAYLAIAENIDTLEIPKPQSSKKQVKTYVVSGCWHVPFHNKILYEGFKNLLRDINPDGLVLAGDFIDVGSLGEYERGKMSKTGVTLEDEYMAANVVLDEIDAILSPTAERFYLYGNHCARYFRWKSDVNNSKYGDLLSPTRGMKLLERGYVTKEDYMNDFLELGSLQILHGYYYNVHCAKQHLDKLRRNNMFVHTHRSQMFRTGDFASWNIGFMGDVNAPCFTYADRAMRGSWSNGFALVHVTDKEFYVEPIDVVNSNFVYGGRKY